MAIVSLYVAHLHAWGGNNNSTRSRSSNKNSNWTQNAHPYMYTRIWQTAEHRAQAANCRRVIVGRRVLGSVRCGATKPELQLITHIYCTSPSTQRHHKVFIVLFKCQFTVLPQICMFFRRFFLLMRLFVFRIYSDNSLLRCCRLATNKVHTVSISVWKVLGKHNNHKLCDERLLNFKVFCVSPRLPRKQKHVKCFESFTDVLWMGLGSDWPWSQSNFTINFKQISLSGMNIVRMKTLNG